MLHLLYSRFITMVLHDAGLLDFEEPFRKFRAHGLIVKDGAKMSKSRGNVVVPDEYIDKWGADTFRMYLMFLGPFQEGGDFRDAGISGPRRFLDKVWDLVDAGEPPGCARRRDPSRGAGQVAPDQAAGRARELEGLRYNTAIAALMELLNALREYNCCEPMVVSSAGADDWRRSRRTSPRSAGSGWATRPSVFDSTWPAWDPALTIEDTVTIGVQVNGKTRGTVTLARDADEATGRSGRARR